MSAGGTVGARTSPFLKVATYPASGWTVVVVAGELDIDTEQALRHGLREALAQSVHGLDLDFAGVDFCDCSGLNVLLHIRRLALAEAKTVRIQTAGLAVEHLLALTRTWPLFAHPDDAGPGVAANGQGMCTGSTPNPEEEESRPRKSRRSRARNGPVVVDQLGLGDPVVREQLLVGVGQRHFPVADAYLVLGLRLGAHEFFLAFWPGRSRTTSGADLSVRGPMDRGRRSFPYPVRSVNPISATSCGRIHGGGAVTDTETVFSAEFARA